MQEQLAFQAQLLSEVHEAVFGIDTKDTINYWNTAAEKIFGWSKEEVLGQNSMEFLKAEAENSSSAEQVEKFSNEGRLDRRARYRRKDGTYFFAYTSISLVKDTNGKTLGTVTVARDITEQVKQREALRENQQLHKTLFDNSDDGFELVQPIHDENGKVIDCIDIAFNPAFIKQTALAPENVSGKRLREFLPNVQNLFESFDKVIKTNKSLRAEIYNSDTKTHYEAYCFPYPSNRIGVLLRDITERKKMEDRIIQQNKRVSSERHRLYSLLDNLPALVCLLTKERYVSFVNRPLKKKFGEYAGKHCYEYFCRRKQPCKQCEAYDALKTKEPHYWRIASKDGSVFDIYDSPFTNSDGSPMILEVEVDVTERVKLKQQLKESERLAAIGQTAGMVGHDIRNPLQAMMSDVYLLKQYLTSMPQTQMKTDVNESLDGIEANISYINKIVADLQDFARRLRPEHTDINLHDLTKNVIQQIVLPDNLSVTLNVDESLRTKSDPTLLKRIITNLATNGIQAMPKGGMLTVSASKSDGITIISVQDTGVGIPEDVKAKLFQPMMTTKAKGQGLGLAVVKRLVEALNGKVSFESYEGKGTKFLIELPLIE